MKRTRLRPKSATVPVNQVTQDDSFEENAGSKLCDNIDVYFETLNKTLVNKYVNIFDRLRIRDLPKCLTNPQECAKIHYKNEVISLAYEDTYLAKTLLEGNQPLTVLRVIELYVENDEFVDYPIMEMILELILTVNDSESNGYSIDCVIERAVICFKKVLGTFPPCWLATMDTYRSLICKPVDRNGLIKEESTALNQNLLSYLIELIDSLIQPSSLKEENEEINMNSSQVLRDFTLWNDASEQKYSFSKHPRQVKIVRVFIVFDLIMDLLEHDLALWTMKNLRRPTGAMRKMKNTPLIAQFLWPENQLKDVNFKIKNLIKIYLDLISIDFDDLMIKSYGRLINLICNIFELSQDHATQNNGITYPFEWKGEYRFGVAFHKVLKKHQSYSSSLFMKVIDYIEVPTLRKVLIETFLFELDKKPIECTVKSMMKLLTKAKVSPDSDVENENNNVSKQVDKYPCIQAKKRKYTSSLSDREYLNLIWDGLKSYAEVKHLKEIYRNLSKNEEIATENGNETKANNFRKPKNPKRLSKADEKAMKSATIGKKIEKQLRDAKNDLISPYQPIDLGEVSLITLESAKQYREDIKYMHVIMSQKKNLPIDSKEIDSVLGTLQQ